MEGVQQNDKRIVDMFHSATGAQSKTRILNEFKKDSILRVIVCTIAFGMGIDISDVRTVILWGMPQSMFDLWQEVGRCGRDGKMSTAIGFFFPRSMVCKKCPQKCGCRERSIMDSLIKTAESLKNVC
jgi:superfamily II DNA helicase RecQ